MSGSRVWATNIVLGSMVVAAFGGILKGLSTVMESLADRPDNPSKQPASSPEAKSVAAIAAPETFGIQAIATLATEVSAGSPSDPLAMQAVPKPATPIRPGARPIVSARMRSGVTAVSGNPMLAPNTVSPMVATPETLSDLSEFSQPTMSSEPIDVSLNDIQGHWAQYYIEFLAARNILRGFPGGSFRPDQKVTAGEFARMVQRATQNSGTPAISYRSLQAMRPGGAPSRAEAAALIYRAIIRTEMVESVTNIQIKGDVRRPGSYSLAAASDPRLGRGNNLPTLSRALQQAGGTLTTADLRRVEIHRLNASGKPQVTRIDVQKLLAEGDLAQDVVVQQDDLIVIRSIATAATPAQPAVSSRQPEQRPNPQQVQSVKPSITTAPPLAPAASIAPTPTPVPSPTLSPEVAPSPAVDSSPNVDPNPTF